MFGVNEVIELLAAFCGTLGFGIVFNIRGKKLVLTGVGGMITWALYLVLTYLLDSVMLCYFIISLVMSVYSEVLARLMKTPATTFCTTSLIPLVPGSALYYAVEYVVEGDLHSFFNQAGYTLGLAASLSIGIIIVTAVSKTIFARRQNRTHP